MYRNLFIISFSVICISAAILGLGSALTPLLISFALADLSFPLVRNLEKSGVKRVYAVSFVFVTIFAFLTILVIAIIPGLIRDLTVFIVEMPEHINVALVKLESFIVANGIHVEIDQKAIVSVIKEYSSKMSLEQLLSITTFIKGTFQGVLSTFLGILNIFLFPLFFFYIIYDFEKISNELKFLIPRKHKSEIDEFFNKSNTIFQGFLRGQLLVALILASLYAISLSILGIKFGLTIGILTGLFSIIPYVGVTLGLVSSLIIALASSTGYGILLGILGIFITIQIFESFILTPKIVGDKVGISALTTMLALIVFGNLFGFLGLLVAIPTAGILKVIFIDIKSIYKKSSLYS